MFLYSQFDYIFYFSTYNLLKDVFLNFYYENTSYNWYLFYVGMIFYINNMCFYFKIHIYINIVITEKY